MIFLSTWVPSFLYELKNFLLRKNENRDREIEEETVKRREERYPKINSVSIPFQSIQITD